MILGVSLSHDSSIALTESDGEVTFALAEERITRKKNFWGIPSRSLTYVTTRTSSIDEVIIGSHANINEATALRFLAELELNPSNKPGTHNLPFPGLGQRLGANFDPKKALESSIESILHHQGVSVGKFTWVNHHNSHLGSALGLWPGESMLVFSFDGEGDGESGAIAYREQCGKIHSLARVKSLDSLGNLYSLITARYNFMMTRHEGKITGLAAFGKPSPAVKYLRDFIEVENGIPKFRLPRTKTGRQILRLLKSLGLFEGKNVNIFDVVPNAEALTSDYADLAFAIQTILEEKMIEIVGYWIERVKPHRIGLSGGVFANVSLNRKLAETFKQSQFRIFPNMGDGGISVGGIWHELNNRSQLKEGTLFKNMYLAPDLEKTPLDSNHLPPNIKRITLPNVTCFKLIAKLIARGYLVGIHSGRMEFGPRALGNRTLLIDPRDRKTNQFVNMRLNRTEFMPFAPVVTDYAFNKFFHTFAKDLHPFSYMTMTCEVREEFRTSLGAITHIDGSARPQIIDQETNPMIFKILQEFEKISGFAVMVNTSLNMHEQPINGQIFDSIKQLAEGSFDFLFDGQDFFYGEGSQGKILNEILNKEGYHGNEE